MATCSTLILTVVVCGAISFGTYPVVLGEAAFEGWKYTSKHPTGLSEAKGGQFNDSVYVLGDYQSSEYVQEIPKFDSLWVFNEKTFEWFWRMASGDIPIRRRSYCLAVVKEKLFMFGGTLLDFYEMTNTMYSIDLTTFEWAIVKYSSKDKPSSRNSMSCTAYEDQIYMFGGYDGRESTDLWVFNTAASRWTEIKPSDDDDIYTVPPSYDPYVGLLDDTLVMYSAPLHSYGFGGYFFGPPSLYKYNITKQRWEPPVETTNKPIYSYGSASIYKRSMYIYGGALDFFLSSLNGVLLIVNLDTLETEELMTNNTGYPPKYPIAYPSPRANQISVVSSDRLIVIGGYSYCSQNDFWVFDLEKEIWVNNSLSKYPLARESAHFAIKSKNEIIMFGGDVCYNSFTEFNDMWILNTDGNDWERLTQESDCSIDCQSCLPPVRSAAFGFWNETLYLIGGFSSICKSAVLKSFSFETMSWSNMRASSVLLQTLGTRYNTANVVIGHKLYVWGGNILDGVKDQPSVYIFDMKTFDGAIYTNSTNTPFIPYFPKGIQIGDQFCFAEPYKSYHENYDRFIWCFDEDLNEWSQIASMPSIIPENGIVGYSSNLISFGGWEFRYISNQIWMGISKSSYWEPFSFEKMAPGNSMTTLITHAGLIYVIGGRITFGITNIIYTLDLRKMWCDGVQKVSSKDKTLTDGSGDFKYFPGSNCTWMISNTNFIVVDYVNITMGTTLRLYQDECGKGFMLNGSVYSEIFLGKNASGDSIEIISGNAYVSFQVDEDADTDDGFSLQLFDCNFGFIARYDGCICEQGRFINFRQECIPCPEGSEQMRENQVSCNNKTGVTGEDKNNIMDELKQTQSMELSNSLPPFIHGSAAVVGSYIYLVGGTTSVDIQKTELYHSMESIYKKNLENGFSWERTNMKGNIPSTRVLNCMISMGTYGVLIGGKTKHVDNFVYFLDSNSKKWIRKSKMPISPIGSQCQRQDNDIYVLGGENENGEHIQSTYIYTPAIEYSILISGNNIKENDTWRKVVPQRSAWRIFGSMVFFQDQPVIFGGSSGNDEPEEILYLDQGFELQSQAPINIQTCIPCDEEGGRCLFGRRHFASSKFGGELHVFGGMRKGDILGDVFVVDLGSGEIIHRENYGLTLPDLPLTVPPPKFGAISVSYGKNMMIIGGATSMNNVVNDVWVWDAEYRTWIDSSVTTEPISRKEPGFGLFDEENFILFGGSTEYFSEVLLNDLWIFDIENRTWTLLFPGSLQVGPQPRAGAIVTSVSSKIYISGGRTDIGVFDTNIWVFDIEQSKWGILEVDNHLTSNQRPFNRFGIKASRLKDSMWLWGGQILPGTRKIEFYSAVMETNYKSNSISSKGISGDTPVTFMCTFGGQNLTLYGGVDVNKKAMNDHWVYNTDTLSWSRENYQSSIEQPYLLNHICSEFDSFTILSGVDINQNMGLSWMHQHKFQRQGKLLHSNEVVGYESMSDNGGGMMKGLVIRFGGANGYSSTNQVVAYKPGFCSSYPYTVTSSYDASYFDDGSGEAMYLENTNCTWILPNATHIILSMKIRTQDKFELFQLSGDSLSSPVFVSAKSYVQKDVLYTSTTGFGIRFLASGVPLSGMDRPCEDCEGFTITHARCPKNSRLDPILKTCLCLKGYALDNELCIEEKNSNSQNFIGIIGGVVGGLVFIVLVAVFVLRKKMIDGLKGAEQKLYGAIEPSELIYGRIIGSGSFGQVFKGEWRGTEVAIKVLAQKQLNKEQIEAFKREISIMVELRHPNIVLYMGACFQSENLCLVCELMHQGSLYDVLHDDRTIPFVQRLQFMSDIAKGMQYLHMSNPPIIHRDLKSLNILVDDRNRLKVSDFGLTTIQGSNDKEVKMGSLLWLAPEAIGGNEYTAAADVYSVGIIAWEIMSRKDPYYDVENISAVTTQVVINQLRPTMPPNIPDDICTLIREMWSHEPLQRPTFQEVSKRINIFTESSRQSSNSSFVAMMNDDEVAPEGNVCVVCTRIFGSEDLWEDMPESMGEAIILQNRIIKQICKKYRGYISQNDGENFVIVFQEASEAIRFCSEIQKRLNEAEWPDEILKHMHGNSICGGELCGLRMQMGIDFGLCQNRIDEDTKRTQYGGKSVSRALKISRMSHGGQIIMTETVYQELEEKIGLIEVENIIREVLNGEIQTESKIPLFEMYPRAFSKRADYYGHRHQQIPTLSGSSELPSKKVIPSNPLPNIPSQVVIENKELESGNPSNNKIGPMKSPTSLSSNKIRLEPLRRKLRDKKDWEIDFNDISTEIKPIGSGSFGSVFSGEYKGRKVAIKKIVGGNHRTVDENYILFLTEVSIFRKLKHPNVVEFIGACTDVARLALVMELVDFGNLTQVLQNHSIVIEDNQKMKMIDGIVQGMAYLHSFNPVILHRDLKSANILVTEAFESKICDFGFARVKANNRTMTKCGTMAYQAPEVMKGFRYNEKADVYSFGIILWEIETREPPYRGKDPLLLQFEVLSGLRPGVTGDMNKTLASMMQRCWNVDPDVRPYFKDLLASK